MGSKIFTSTSSRIEKTTNLKLVVFFKFFPKTNEKNNETCYNKIANKEFNCTIFDYVTNKHGLTYSLENDNTILFFKRA